MRVAIIVPRYGPDVLGGAESQARGFAEAAAQRGWQVAVWTTCAHSHYSWENTYPAGSERLNGVTIQRFPVTGWNSVQQAILNQRLVTCGKLPVAEQYEWLAAGPHSAPLYEYVSRHGAEQDYLVALPYAAPLTHYAAWAASGRTIVWPCLHDEPFAYMETAALLLESTWGVMFNSPEERDLAVQRLGLKLTRQAVLGEGVRLTLTGGSVRAEAEQPSDHLLYVGRLEVGKNLSLLYDYVRRSADEGQPIRLKVVGGGPFEPPVHRAFEKLGFVSEEEKGRLYASALALCQPSLNESFSLTIMESWLAGRPVLVHQDCPVTVGHAARSKGGLWFRSYEEFVGVVAWLQANPDLATRMGQNGRAYVQQNYTWQAVANRFEQIVAGWTTGSEGGP